MKFLDFFAGIGGFRLGLEKAGHECMGHCEIDKYAHKSYAAIHQPKEWEWYKDDITTVKPTELPQADCYCAGFPCQSFSVAGKRGGFEDTRGTLFFEVMRLAKVRKPKYLFLENVKGLLSHDGGKTFGTILNTMGELGYDAEYQVLNSKDFGVPQNRERVFIIGHFRGRSRREVFPITKTSGNSINQLIGDIQQGRRVYSTDGISCALQAEGGGWGAKTGLYKLSKPYKSITIHDQSIRNIKDKDIVNCIDANYHKGLDNKGQRSGLYDGDRIRRLTPKECFRLQGFPDWAFERAAKVNSDSQLYKQAGNSVTVNVIYEIAKRL